MANQISFNEFQAQIQDCYPEFIQCTYDDYYNQFVATTERQQTVLTYDCEEGTFTYAFNGVKGTAGESIEEAKGNFDAVYNRIMRDYELSILNNRLS